MGPMLRPCRVRQKCPCSPGAMQHRKMERPNCNSSLQNWRSKSKIGTNMWKEKVRWKSGGREVERAPWIRHWRCCARQINLNLIFPCSESHAKGKSKRALFLPSEKVQGRTMAVDRRAEYYTGVIITGNMRPAALLTSKLFGFMPGRIMTEDSVKEPAGADAVGGPTYRDGLRFSINISREGNS